MGLCVNVWSMITDGEYPQGTSMLQAVTCICYKYTKQEFFLYICYFKYSSSEAVLKWHSMVANMIIGIFHFSNYHIIYIYIQVRSIPEKL